MQAEDARTTVSRADLHENGRLSPGRGDKVVTRKVVVSLLTEEQEFQRMQATDARETAARLGLEVDVVFAESNAVLQIQQLFRFVHAAEEERPAAIVVEGVARAGMERLGKNALAEGIGWVLVNETAPYLADLRTQFPGLLVSSVRSDEEEIGRIQGRQAKALLPSGGALLCLQGPPDTLSTEGRTQGLREEIGGTALELRGELHGDWTEAGGERAVSNWLRLKSTEAFRPALVVSQNDAMAMGARAAIQAQRTDWASVPLIGCDGLPGGGQRLVQEGVLRATVIKPTTTGHALELVARSLEGQVVSDSVILSPRSHPPEGDLAARRLS
jgi:ABC-type sugar transport system substrate-binding protein